MYALVAVAVAFEIWVLWLLLNPAVPPDYRAYYIDRTTTCLNQPVSGQYAFGTTIDFAMEGRVEAKLVRVCGWERPAGDGTHAVGEISRLRFALPDGTTGPLSLDLEMIAVARGEVPRQRVEVVVNGAPIGAAEVASAEPAHFEFSVPADVTGTAPLDVELRYPDAIRMGEFDSNTRWRSIKLLSASLAPATTE